MINASIEPKKRRELLYEMENVMYKKLSNVHTFQYTKRKAQWAENELNQKNEPITQILTYK